MAIEIVDLPIDSMVILHSYVTVYQRVRAQTVVDAFLWTMLPHLAADFCAKGCRKIMDGPYARQVSPRPKKVHACVTDEKIQHPPWANTFMHIVMM